MVFGFGLFGAIKSDHPVQNAMGSVGRAVLSTWFLTMKWSDIGRDELLLIRASERAHSCRSRMSGSSSLPLSNHFMVRIDSPLASHAGSERVIWSLWLVPLLEAAFPES